MHGMYTHALLLATTYIETFKNNNNNKNINLKFDGKFLLFIYNIHICMLLRKYKKKISLSYQLIINENTM